MEPSRRFHLLLPAELDGALRTFADEKGVALAAALRELAMTGLAAARRSGAAEDSAAILATLCAAEHAVLMVASVLPEGERRMRSLSERAALAAEERLALFRQPARDPEGAGG
jgi:hypothetical protein